MSKVITFSRVFPAYHPKAGQPTFFVEQIYNSIYRDKSGDWSEAPGTTSNYVVDLDHTILGHKHHTIRNGNRWKVGEKFSPRVWSGKPYASKQIVIAEDLEIKQIFTFQKDLISDKWYVNGVEMSSAERINLAKNDGLPYKDLLSWFKKPFTGQIVCWSDAVSYGCSQHSSPHP